MQNHTLKFSEWLEQRDPELFIEMDMNRRGFMASLGAAAATSMVGKKAFGNNDDDEDTRDPCEEMKNSQRRIASLQSSLAYTNFDASSSANKLRNKHKPFTDSRIGKDYQNYFPDPHGTINNPYKPTFPTAGGGNDEVEREYKNHIEYIKNQKSADLKTVKYLEDKIKNLKKNPNPNQEEIQHYEKIIDIHNHIMKNGVSKHDYEIPAKPTKDHHPHQDYYNDMKTLSDIDKSHAALLASVADTQRRLTDEEGLFDQLRISCERKIDDIIYKKLKSQHGDNTLNISPKDTLYILKYGSRHGSHLKLKELAEELGKSNTERLNSSQVKELVNDNFESSEYFKTLINILGSEKIKSMFPSIDLLLRNFYKFVENSYDNYLQDVFDFIIGKRNLINLPVEKVFIILYTSYLISRSGKLKDSDEKYISIIIKNLGMHNMAKLGKAHWDDLDKVLGNTYGVNIIKKVYEKMRPKTYAPQFGE